MYNIQLRGCNKSFQIFNTKRVIIILIHLKRRPTVMIYIEENWNAHTVLNHIHHKYTINNKNTTKKLKYVCSANII